MARGQIIYSKSVGMVNIAFADRSSIKLEGMALILDCKLNLISLSQL